MFGKFMNKKFFHPSSYPNVKQKWIHEQRATAKEKGEEEKQATYQKEQESYQSRLLSAKSTGDKLKLGLNFMYDLPPGMNKVDEKEDAEGKTEVKFEWQKVAPRSKYINDLGLECQDQPFGVCVRNIRCFKCRAWGHQNTDRECPLFFSNVNSEANTSGSQAQSLRLSDPLRLVAEMRKQHGITLKRSVIGQEIDPMAENQQLLDSGDENSDLGEADLAYIESLTDKEKKKLLKSLNKLEKTEKKKHKRKKKKHNDKGKQRDNEEKYLDKREHIKSVKRKRKYSESPQSDSDNDITRKIKECRSTDNRTKRKSQDDEYSKKRRKRYKKSP